MAGVWLPAVLLVFTSLFAGAVEPMRVAQQNNITIVFPPELESLARETIARTQHDIVALAPHLPNPPDKLRIILCSTTEQFAVHAGKYGKARVGGVAKSEEGLIVLKAPRLQRLRGEYWNVLTHELAHILIARNTDVFNVPRWLNEGVAMMLSGDWSSWTNTFSVGWMQMNGRILPLWYLDMAFEEPGHETVFSEAYSQGLDMTKFLRKHLGEEKFWALIRGMKSLPFEEAIVAHGGMSPGEFYEAWRGTLWKTALATSILSGFTGFQLATILVLLAYWRLRRKNKRILRRWEMEESLIGPGPGHFRPTPDTPWDEVVEEEDLEEDEYYDDEEEDEEDDNDKSWRI
jgi:hypothetical protein